MLFVADKFFSICSKVVEFTKKELNVDQGISNEEGLSQNSLFDIFFMLQFII
jgi:hypothetical protein